MFIHQRSYTLFRTTLRISPLFIAIAATIPALGQAAEERDKQGFVAGSSLKLNARNYYMNRNRLQQADDNIAWGQGFLGIFESGFTEGRVGFGFDAHAMLGLKLDGGGGTDNSSILPVSDGQRHAWLHAHGEVLAEDEAGEDERGPLRRLQVRLDPRELGRFTRL